MDDHIGRARGKRERGALLLPPLFPLRPCNCPGAGGILQTDVYTGMSGGIKYRLIAFVLAIAGMCVLIAWAAHSSLRRSGELGDKLTSVQFESFKIADHLQQTIWELNNFALRYAVYRDTNDWAHFQTVSKELDHWIDDQNPTTRQEKAVLD